MWVKDIHSVNEAHVYFCCYLKPTSVLKLSLVNMCIVLIWSVFPLLIRYKSSFSSVHEIEIIKRHICLTNDLLSLRLNRDEDTYKNM